MSLKEINKIDKIEVLENGVIQIRIATIIEKDNIEIAKTYHRNTLSPIDDISNQDLKVQLIASVIWTKDVIDNFKQLV